MTSESINKSKRPIFHYVIGTTFLACIIVVYVFTQPGTRSMDKVARDSHGADGPSWMTGQKTEVTKLHANNLVPPQDVQVITINIYSFFCFLYVFFFTLLF